MRLVCPNCGAEYEVPSGVIPEEGRDVQCSNCGHTWFQHHPDHAPGTETEPEEQEPAATAFEDAPDTNETETEPVEEPAADIGEEEHPEEAEPVGSTVDPDVAALLREEAEREARARAEEAARAAGLESQPDLGIEEGSADPDTMHGEEPDREAVAAAVAATAAAGAGSRRDVLPDIDDINASLRSTRERKNDDGLAEGETEHAPEKRRGGFRRGFSLVILLAIIAVAVYAMSDRIGAALPQAKPWLDSYVVQVDRLRGWLDIKADATAQWLDSLASESGSSDN